LLVGSLGVSLLISEFLLRVVSPTAYYVWRPGRRAVTTPRPDVMPGINGRKRFSINDWGIRGDAFSDDQDYRILAIGGSTTECFYQDDSETWPYLLQEQLGAKLNRRVWVGSVGKSGHNSQNHILTARLLLDQYPRIDAIVLLVGVNDLHQRLARAEDYEPAPDLDSLTPAQYHRYLRGTFDVYPVRYLAHLPAHERTEIWERVRTIEYRLDKMAYRQELDGSQYARWRSYRQAATRLRTQLPDLAGSLGEYARNIETIIGLAKERGVRPIFLSQPTMWRPDLEPEIGKLVWMGGVGDYTRGTRGTATDYYSIEALAEGMKLYNDTLRRVCRENEVECVDLDVLLPKDLTMFFDDCHFNDSGCRNVAAAIADYLLEASRRARLLIRATAPAGRFEAAPR
jgi:lysophospholipase L1-like esterase